jgi:hypothetical protein
VTGILVMGPFVKGPFVVGPFVMGPLVMGPYVGVPQQHQQYWWQNFPLVSLIPVTNFPPGSLMPVVHLTCKYLREFSTNFEMTLILFSGARER